MRISFDNLVKRGKAALVAIYDKDDKTTWAFDLDSALSGLNERISLLEQKIDASGGGAQGPAGPAYMPDFDPMRVLRGDGTPSEALVEFRDKLDGDMSQLPILPPDSYGYLVMYDPGKCYANIISFTCAFRSYGDRSFVNRPYRSWMYRMRAVRNGEGFFIAEDDWREIADTLNFPWLMNMEIRHSLAEQFASVPSIPDCYAYLVYYSEDKLAAHLIAMVDCGNEEPNGIGWGGGFNDGDRGLLWCRVIRENPHATFRAAGQNVRWSQIGKKLVETRDSLDGPFNGISPIPNCYTYLIYYSQDKSRAYIIAWNICSYNGNSIYCLKAKRASGTYVKDGEWNRLAIDASYLGAN